LVLRHSGLIKRISGENDVGTMLLGARKMSEPTREISFEDYQSYRRWITSGTPNSDTDNLLIISSAEFDAWWTTIATCEKLKQRWIRRIKHRDEHVKDVKNQIESLGRAA